MEAAAADNQKKGDKKTAAMRGGATPARSRMGAPWLMRAGSRLACIGVLGVVARHSAEPPSVPAVHALGSCVRVMDAAAACVAIQEMLFILLYTGLEALRSCLALCSLG